MRSDVSPRTAVNDALDRLSADAEQGAKVNVSFATGGSGPDLEDLVVGEAGVALTFSYRLSALRLSVSDVVGLAPQEQMVGVHTAGVVAAVKDALARRDRPVGFRVGPSMGTPETPVPSHLTVATPVGGLRPQDAVTHDGMVTR